MPTWKEVTAADPAHSHKFARKWKTMQAQGQDIHGEARLADAMSERGSRILDAGCGSGRLGGELINRGHTVVGVDVDPILIDYAQKDYPEGEWVVGDLTEGPIEGGPFDLAVAAGNVMGFIAEEGREAALSNIFDALRPGGRFICGFGAGRGWEFSDFLEAAANAGYRQDFVFSSWDLKRFTDNSTFLVAVLARPGAGLIY